MQKKVSETRKINALLVVAHGSRRTESNEEIKMLTDKVRRLAGDHFDLVQCAFLELAAPSIEQGVDQLVSDGAQSVLVLPYFLARGAHVASDIPREINAARARHPALTIETSQYLGESEVLPTLLLQLALQHSTSV